MASKFIIKSCLSRTLQHSYSKIVLIRKSFIHKLSYDKQKNLNSIHQEAKQFTRKQFKNSSFQDEYLSCNNPDDILQLLSKYEDSNEIISHHIWAIQRLATLQEFKLCWKIFDDLSAEPKYLPFVSAQLYTTMMWLSCYQHMSQSDKIRNDKLRRKKTCDKIFSLLHTLKTKLNIEIDCDSLTTIISSCCKLHQFGRALGFWNAIKNDEKLKNITLNIDVYNAMFDLYSKSDEMSEAYELYENIRRLNNVSCDNLTFAILINGAHKHGDMQSAQRIFDESRACLAPNKPHKDVYCAIMNGYASRGNIMKCWDLFTEMLGNYENNPNVMEYKPDMMVFSVMLKSLTRLNNSDRLRRKKRKQTGKFTEISVNGEQHSLNVEDCWKMIKYILLKMKELNIKRNVVIYGLLFHLCGDAFGETHCKYNIAQKFYEQMMDEKVEISSLCFHNFLRVGLCHFNVIEVDQDKKEKFVKWILNEIKEHNVAISSQTRMTLRGNGFDIVDYGGMDTTNVIVASKQYRKKYVAEESAK